MQYLRKNLAICMIASMTSAGVSAQQNFKMEASVNGLKEGILYTYLEKGIDSVKVQNGKFVLEKTDQEPVGTIYFLRTKNLAAGTEKDKTVLYMEPGVMRLVLDYADFSKSKLTGSKTQTEYDLYTEMINAISRKYKKQNDSYNAANQKYLDAVAAKQEETEIDKLKFAASDAKNLLEPQSKEKLQASLKFIQENPKSYISLQTLMFNLRSLDYEQASGYYQALDPKFTKTKMGIMVQGMIDKMKKGVPGTKGKSFEKEDINGLTLKLDSYRGNYVLIDFWASWCVPCRKGNPHLLKLYAEYKPKGFEIIGVSDDDKNPSAWKKAVEKDGIGIWNHVLRGLQYKKGTYERINTDQDINDAYNIQVLPTKILLDPEGMIIARYDGGAEDDRKMDQDLARIYGTKK